MGKKTGLVLTGLGMFVLALALLSRFYMYDRLAVVPLDQESVSASVGDDATVFSIAEGGEITTDVQSTVNVVGDVEASEEASDKLDRDVAVWEKLVYTAPPGATVDEENPPLSASHDRIAFDRHTAEVVEWEDTYISSSADVDTGTEVRDTDTQVQGLYFKFPFNVQKKTYPWWDGSMKQAVDIDYKGTETLKGLTVYRFEQAIEPTDVGDINAPASMFGLDEEGDVTLDRMYSNTRTLWVEPETGVLMKSQEDQYVTAEYQGSQVATLTDVVSVFDDETITANIDEYEPLSSQLKIVRVWLPLLGGILGAVLLLAGVFLLLRDRSQSGRRVA